MTKQLVLFFTFFLKNSAGNNKNTVHSYTHIATAVGATEKCDDGNFSLITTQETLERCRNIQAQQ